MWYEILCYHVCYILLKLFLQLYIVILISMPSFKFFWTVIKKNNLTRDVQDWKVLQDLWVILGWNDNRNRWRCGSTQAGSLRLNLIRIKTVIKKHNRKQCIALKYQLQFPYSRNSSMQYHFRVFASSWQSRKFETHDSGIHQHFNYSFREWFISRPVANDTRLLLLRPMLNCFFLLFWNFIWLRVLFVST